MWVCASLCASKKHVVPLRHLSKTQFPAIRLDFDIYHSFNGLDTRLKSRKKANERISFLSGVTLSTSIEMSLYISLIEFIFGRGSFPHLRRALKIYVCLRVVLYLRRVYHGHASIRKDVTQAIVPYLKMVRFRRFDRNMYRCQSPTSRRGARTSTDAEREEANRKDAERSACVVT